MKGETANYTQSLGGKIGINDIDTIGAQVNLHHLNWEDSYSSNDKKAKSNGVGITLGYNKNIDSIHIIPLISYSRLKNKIKGNQHSQYNTHQASVAVAVNKKIPVAEKITLIPSATLQYSRLKADKVQDKKVTVDKYSLQQTTITIGMDTAFKLTDKSSLITSLGFDRDLQRENQASFVFNFNPDNPKDYKGWNIYKSRYLFGLAWIYQPQENISIGLNYQFRGGEKMKSNAVNGMFSYEFD